MTWSSAAQALLLLVRRFAGFLIRWMDGWIDAYTQRCIDMYILFVWLFVISFIYGSFSFFTHGRHDSLYASIVKNPNQHIRFCLIGCASIVVFQPGQEGSTTSIRIPLGQLLKNPKKSTSVQCRFGINGIC